MKVDGEIPQGIIKAAWARMLAKQMEKAAETDRSIRLMKWQSINNKLRDWGLWPIDKI